MTRDEKIATLKENLSDIELSMIREIIVSADVKDCGWSQYGYDDVRLTLVALANEFHMGAEDET